MAGGFGPRRGVSRQGIRRHGDLDRAAVEPSRLSARGSNNRADVDAVEVVVKLAQPGPLTAG